MGAPKRGIAAITYTPTGALCKPPIEPCDYSLCKLRQSDGSFVVELRDHGKRPRHRGRVVQRDAEAILRLERGRTVMCTVLQAVKPGGREGRVAWELGIKAPGLVRGRTFPETEVMKVKREVEVKMEEGGGDHVSQGAASGDVKVKAEDETERESIWQVEEAMRGVKIEEDTGPMDMTGGPIVNVEEAMGGMRIKDEIHSQEEEL